MTGKWSGYVVIAVLGGLLLAGVYRKCYRDYDLALERYHAASRARAETVARSIEGELDLIHRNLKMLSRLSGLYAGADVSPAAAAVIGTIFDNLADSAGVSALYIQPVGEGAAPLFSFGSGAVGEMREGLTVQRNWFQKRYAGIHMAAGADVPMIGGPEIVTDGAPVRTGDDAAGMVLSAPYFDGQGRLGGVIAAVLRSKVLQDMLPDGDYAIVNAAYNYAKTQKTGGQADLSAEWVRQGLPDPSLLYAQVLPLNILDPIGQWHIWSGHADLAFYEGPDVAAIRTYQWSCFGLIFVLMGLSCALWAAVDRGRAAAGLRFQGSVRAAEEGSRATFDFLIDKIDALERHADMADAAASQIAEVAEAQTGSPARAIRDEVAAVLRVIRTMRDMLAVGRQDGALAREVFDARAVLGSVGEAVRAPAAEKGLDFEVEFRNGDASPVLVGDPMALGRVLLNVALNAVQYTKKGFVRVECGFEPLEDDRILLCMDVVDSGVGIAFGRQTALFAGGGADTVTTTAPQSPSLAQDGAAAGYDPAAQRGAARGMGMLITKTLLDRLGGTIDVESTEGIGSTFRIRIPFDTARLGPSS